LRRPGAYPVYLILSGASTLFSAMMFTVLSVYYVTVVGLNPLQLVLVGTALEVTAFLFEVPTGVVADVYSRRLSVIIGTFLVGVCFVIEGLVPLFGAILLAEVIRGVGETFISGAREAWVADEVGEARVGQVFMRAAQVRQAARLAGTFAGVGLASVQLNLPVVLGGGLIMALGLFLVFAMPEQGFRPAPREGRTSWQTMGHTFREGARVVRRSPVLLTLLGVEIFGGAASEGFDRLRDAHLLTHFRFPETGGLKPVVWFGVLSAGSQVLGFLAIQVFGRRLDRAGRNPSATARTLLALEALTVLSIFVFGLAGNFALALGALWAKAVVGGLAGPLQGAWLVQNIDPRVRATVLSMNSQANAFGQAAGGPAIGLIGTVRSLRAAMAASGVALSPAVALYAHALRRAQGSRRGSERGTAGEGS
jgi:DHA3 family tetracycline resistance protein-like MFS transporter